MLKRVLINLNSFRNVQLILVEDNGKTLSFCIFGDKTFAEMLRSPPLFNFFTMLPDLICRYNCLSYFICQLY